jgi:uncharacterized membrane protein (UPF0127 family)
MHTGIVVIHREDTAIADFVLSQKTETALERLKGLLGQPSLTDDICLWINPCNSIHMFFMQHPLDVIYLDVNNIVCKLVSNIQPWHMSAKLRAHSVLEIAAGGIHRHGVQLGDRVTWQA